MNRLTLCPVQKRVRARFCFFFDAWHVGANHAKLVWCWGWDGAGDLDGPDVDPVWEEVPEKAKAARAVEVQHDRSFKKR